MIKIAFCSLKPGPVCLQGGCGYCGEYDSDIWIDSDALAQYADDNGMWSDYVYGRDRQWPNYWKKDGHKKFHSSPVNMDAAKRMK